MQQAKQSAVHCRPKQPARPKARGLQRQLAAKGGLKSLIDTCSVFCIEILDGGTNEINVEKSATEWLTHTPVRIWTPRSSFM